MDASKTEKAIGTFVLSLSVVRHFPLRNSSNVHKKTHEKMWLINYL